MTPHQIAADAIDAFIDYLDRADCDLMLSENEIERAKAAALREVGDAAPAVNAELLAACIAAQQHTSELRDAWQRGALRDIDGQGGTRSNRNVDVEVQLRKAIADAKEQS